MYRVLVAGGGGFIGGHLVADLLEKGADVVVADIKPIEQWCQVHDDAWNYVIDLTTLSACRNMCKGVNVVYNLAADMGGMGFIATHRVDCMESALISINLLHAANDFNVDKFFYASSACVYPDFKQTVTAVNLVEEDAWPADPEPGYGLEKLYGEQIAMFYQQERKLDTRIARFHNIFGPCFDDKTEILTRSGWKRFNDLDSEDHVATLNTDDGVLEYQLPVAKQAYWYEGEMYSVESARTSQLVTPDHSLFLSENSNAFTLKKAKDIRWDRARMRFSNDFIWHGNSPEPTVVLPETRMKDGCRLHDERVIDTKLWLEFVGWYISEGSSWITDRNYTVCITQMPGPAHDRIGEIIRDMGFTAHENGRYGMNWIVSNKQLYEAVQCFGKGARSKQISNWMLQLDSPFLQVLFDALMAGDGDADGGRYSTSSLILADQMQELALKLGLSASVSIDTDACYRILLSSRRDFTSKREHRDIVHYSGMVYDVTVPRWHVLLVRRNGKAVFSGNCGTYDGGREKAPAAICRKVAQCVLSGDTDIEIWGDGEQTRSFLYVDECIEGIHRITDSDYKYPLNLGSDELVSINQLVSMVESIAGVELNRVYNTTAPQGVRGRNSDNTLIKETLGWAPSAKLQTGLEKTYAWIYGELLSSDAGQKA